MELRNSAVKILGILLICGCSASAQGLGCTEPSSSCSLEISSPTNQGFVVTNTTTLQSVWLSPIFLIQTAPNNPSFNVQYEVSDLAESIVVYSPKGNGQAQTTIFGSVNPEGNIIGWVGQTYIDSNGTSGHFAYLKIKHSNTKIGWLPL